MSLDPGTCGREYEESDLGDLPSIDPDFEVCYLDVKGKGEVKGEVYSQLYIMTFNG